MKKTIYLIEDDAKNLKLFRAILERLPDVDLHAFMDGNEGFAALREIIPDLVLLDIQLPGMSGIEICQELRKIKEYKDVLIIAITALAMKGDKERIMAAGFNEYISKPIQVQEFRSQINEFLSS